MRVKILTEIDKKFRMEKEPRDTNKKFKETQFIPHNDKSRTEIKDEIIQGWQKLLQLHHQSLTKNQRYVKRQ